MRPFILYRRNYDKNKIGWQQSATDVKFQPTKLRYTFLQERVKVRQYWTLSFSVEFEQEGDSMFIAYCVPYTYSQLLSDIHELASQARQIMTSGSTGRSRIGLQIPAMVITDPRVDDSEKKVVFVTGRIHPMESNGSIVLWGLVKYLCSNEASALRKCTVFVVIPMVNPDGVVLGNSRTGVLGKDLNREYNNPRKQLYPELQHIKTLVLQIQKTHEVLIFLDFHGHSQRKNAFMYGPEYPLSDLHYLKSKVLPKLLSLKTKMFRYYSCSFKIAEDKISTGRAFLFTNLGVPYTYTVQSSNGFYYNSESRISYEFNKATWLQLGDWVGKTLEQYFRYLIQYEEILSWRRQTKLNRGLKNSIVNEKKEGSTRQVRNTFNQEIDKTINTVQNKLDFASILQKIKIEQIQKEQVTEESAVSAHSDSADEMDDMESLKQISLNTFILQNNKGSINRPPSRDKDRHQFQEIVDRKKQRGSLIQKRKAKSIDQIKQQDVEKEILQQFSIIKRKFVNFKKERETRLGKWSPEFQLMVQAHEFNKSDIRKSITTRITKGKLQKRNFSQLENQKANAETTYLLNLMHQDAQNKPTLSQKIISSTRPIEIGRDIKLPCPEERSHSRTGFSGSDWYKNKKRLLRKQVTLYPQEQQDCLSNNIIKPTLRHLSERCRERKEFSPTIDYNKILKAVIVLEPDPRMPSNSFRSPAGQQHRRLSSAKRPSIPGKVEDESSHYLQVRKYH